MTEASGTMMTRIGGALRSAPAVAVMVALLWLVAVPLFGINARVLPPLPAVLADAAAIWPDLWRSALHTLTSTLVGFATGGVVGIFCGWVFWRVPKAEEMLLPIFVAMQAVPVIAFGAIVVIWFGNGLASKVVIALYLTFFPVCVSTARGLARTDPAQVALLRSFGASADVIFRKLSLPVALPAIMTGLKLGISLSLVGAIVGEWFGDTLGLGVMLLQSLYFEDVTRVWVLILVLGVIGEALFLAMAALERRYVWWT